MIHSVITGTGSYIPEVVVGNNHFLGSQFFEKNGTKLYQSNKAIIAKFSSITGIRERRYAKPDQNASHLAYLAATKAIEVAAIDQESLDYIIVAHNFGDVAFESNRTTQVPSIASRVKAQLKVHNVNCVAYDVIFGCPGWLQAIIQANYFIRSGEAKKCLVIGTETLSRVIDVHDRDSMIFSDGAAAVVLEASESGNSGVITHQTETYAEDHETTLGVDHSCSPYSTRKRDLYLKMQGRKVYEFALTNVPPAIKAVIDKAGVTIDQVKKILIHQANEKMDRAILVRLFQLFGKTTTPDTIMPMTIDRLGNSSVATIPTLFDLLVKGQLDGHRVSEGDIVVMASVGAGMNINALVYRM